MGCPSYNVIVLLSSLVNLQESKTVSSVAPSCWYKNKEQNNRLMCILQSTTLCVADRTTCPFLFHFTGVVIVKYYAFEEKSLQIAGQRRLDNFSEGFIT